MLPSDYVAIGKTEAGITSLAQDECNRHVSPSDYLACKWCLLGSIMAAGLSKEIRGQYVEEIEKLSDGLDCVIWFDRYSQEYVITAMKSVEAKLGLRTV